ncbi:MAG: phosphate ABC transporter substrate-binding protein PstS [Candidatus Dormiibacterota bacterium]
MTLNEAGSTLIYPYLQVLAPQVHVAYSNITLDPGPGGSGLGISEATAKLVQMGGSDAYLSDAQAAANPSLLNIPIAISAQAVDYNVPGMPANLKITGNILAQMYEGKITEWNDPQLAAINPGVTLPAVKVIPVRRVDSSGDTFIFTSLLTKTNSAWANGPAFGTTVTWPSVATEITANGNPGMIQVCKANPGCIAYIGVSVENTAIQQGLQEALLQNKAGAYLVPDLATITAAVNASAGSTPANLRQSLIYSSGANSYPIINFEYLMVQQQQSDAATAQAIRTFLYWAISPTGGATGSNLSAVDFVALPASVIPKVEAAINKISG